MRLWPLALLLLPWGAGAATHDVEAPGALARPLAWPLSGRDQTVLSLTSRDGELLINGKTAERLRGDEAAGASTSLSFVHPEDPDLLVKVYHSRGTLEAYELNQERVRRLQPLSDAKAAPTLLEHGEAAVPGFGRLFYHVQERFDGVRLGHLPEEDRPLAAVDALFAKLSSAGLRLSARGPDPSWLLEHVAVRADRDGRLEAKLLGGAAARTSTEEAARHHEVLRAALAPARRSPKAGSEEAQRRRPFAHSPASLFVAAAAAGAAALDELLEAHGLAGHVELRSNEAPFAVLRLPDAAAARAAAAALLADPRAARVGDPAEPPPAAAGSSAEAPSRDPQAVWLPEPAAPAPAAQAEAARARKLKVRSTPAGADLALLRLRGTAGVESVLRRVFPGRGYWRVGSSASSSTFVRFESARALQLFLPALLADADVESIEVDEQATALPPELEPALTKDQLQKVEAWEQHGGEALGYIGSGRPAREALADQGVDALARVADWSAGATPIFAAAEHRFRVAWALARHPSAFQVYVPTAMRGLLETYRPHVPASAIAGLDEREVGLAARFVRVSAGAFEMGSPASQPGRDDTEAQHQVTLTQEYELQATPVTQLQFFLVTGHNPSKFSDKIDDEHRVVNGAPLNPHAPVESLTWDEAQEFVRRLNQLQDVYNYRLPTEAEWENAARAGTPPGFPYPFGHAAEELGEHAVYVKNSGGRPQPVASKRPNAWGFYDMLGNVWEWVQDSWNGAHAAVAQTNPTVSVANKRRVVRGGSWVNEPTHLRSASRAMSEASAETIGLRVARTRRRP